MQKTLHDNFNSAKDYKPSVSEWLSSVWKGFMSPSQHSRIRNTGVPLSLLKELGETITTIPEGFTPHRTDCQGLRDAKEDDHGRQ